MSNMNYNQARIYKISCNLPTINEFYIGSTADYESRCINHRSDCHNVKAPNYGYKVYNYIRSKGGFGNFTIDVIEHYPCADKKAMRIREQYWIDELQPTLNGNKAYQSVDDLKQYKHQYKKTVEYKNKWNQVIQCDHCDKTYTRVNKLRHRRSKYCKNYIFIAHESESTTESFIESDTESN